MDIKNSTKSVIISKNAKICKNIFSRTIGLMFSKKPIPLIFVFKKEKIIPLHMFFVFYPIDILFLDQNRVVIEIKENFTPFSFYNPKNKSKYIIELPKNTIKETKTELGDKVEF